MSLLPIDIRMLVVFVQVTLSLVACFSPTFNEEVSLASLSKPKLNYLHAVSTNRISLPTTHISYFPVPAGSMGGFLGVTIKDYPKLYYLKGSSLKGPIEGGEPIPTIPGLESFYGFVLGNYTGQPLIVIYFPYLSNPSIGGSDLLVFSYDVASSSLQGPTIMKKILSDLAVSLYFSITDPSITANDLYLLGLQLRASILPTEVYIDTFILQKSTNRYYELSFRMDTSGTVSFNLNLVANRSSGITYLEFNSSPFSETTVGRYFYSPASKKSYAQVYQQGRYWTFYWDEERTLREIPLQGKVSTILSSGDLLCEDGRYGMLYSSDGRFQYKFGLGTLSIPYELYLNGTPTIVFTEVIDQRAEGGQLFYETYTLPTDDLSKLKE
ncbi:MAG: hypothetical protein N2442_10285 [Spirochaetes bacterium]|nr:hypothetical protein [Spirochaetota bacterium]